MLTKQINNKLNEKIRFEILIWAMIFQSNQKQEQEIKYNHH